MVILGAWIIEPNDVETMTVLKMHKLLFMVSAAANGVILVTTKQVRRIAKEKFL
jgi:hypothetical protein